MSWSFLCQRASYFSLELGPKDANFFLREPNLLCLVGQVPYPQLLITLNKLIVFNEKIFFYWLAITMALIRD